MRHRMLHFVACALVAAAACACHDASSTWVSNGIYKVNLPGQWKEEFDVSGQWLIAAGPMYGEKLEISAICHVGEIDMTRSDLERYVVDELRVPLEKVQWRGQGASTTAWIDAAHAGHSFTRHQLSTDGSCFNIVNYSQDQPDSLSFSTRASAVLLSMQLGRARA